MIVTNENIKV